MKKKNYSVPKLEQVSMEDETPVICSSGGGPNLTGFTASAGSLFTICCLVVATLLPSCEKKENQITTNPVTNDEAVPMEFNCSNEWGSGSHTKVAIDAVTGACTWEKDDKIAVFNNKGDQAVFTLTSGAGSDNGRFSGTIVPSDADENIYYAVYPSSAVKSANGGKSVTVTIPAEQHYIENSTESTLPFAGHSTDNFINFKPVTGILRLGIKGDKSITKATITDNNYTALAGDYIVDCSSQSPVATLTAYGRQTISLICDNPVQLKKDEDTYFSFIVPVGSFANGFVVTLYETNGKTSVINTVKNNSIFCAELKYINNISAAFSDNFLTFTAESDGSTLSLNKVGTPHDAIIYYTTDGNTWSNYNFGENLTLNKSDFVKFRGVNTYFSKDNLNYYNFSIAGDVKASGSIMSLVSENADNNEIPSEYCFYGLFGGCSGLLTAPEMNATTLKPCCYAYMFNNCSKLRTAPALPATSLPDGKRQQLTNNNIQDYDGVYSFMFDGCTSLEYTPELPATKIGTFCYQGMFRGCTSLVSIPKLDLGEVPEGAIGKHGSKNSANGCCTSMFQGCTGLTDTPVISFTKAGKYAFSYIFYGCSNLTKAVLNNTDKISNDTFLGVFMNCSKLEDVTVKHTIWNDDYIYYWLYGVAAKGTFHCPQRLIDNTTSRGPNTVPSGWSMVADD